MTNRRRVFFPGDVDDAGEKAPERIAAQEKLDSFSILQVENAIGGSHKVVHRTLEQFVARE